MIKGERDFDIELFHDNFAGAVREAPTFIVEVLKRLPGERQVGGTDLMYFRKPVIKESRT